MDVALMRNIEDKPVLRRRKDPMHRDGQFDHTQIRTQMASVVRSHFEDFGADVVCEAGQILCRKRFQIFRTTYGGKK
ncbi:MAG: hypothetical protein BWY82_02011 [Verrucomicrobia bacterium ADurb.Bin474]|nr:MAG: hypothetical protein BWY82_02011 [Verrucomicrobia bacterium ADurb.Bin474]